MSAPTSSASSCPLCGGPNQCAMAGTSASASPCWCEQADFSAALLASVPTNAKGRFCICQRCVQRHEAP
ncbi:MAG TPA: cysteine-rich CWC family protein [Burkholderiaceae bacterium]|nr:cysteine-rich CWC family protein [Burkholderiaceae bacterium]